MEPSEVKELKLAAPVWVWIVWLGKGRWWPGTVDRIETAYGLPLVEVRFESFSLSRHRTHPPVRVGLITAPMRRLERRDVNVNGADRPRFVPASRLRTPEKPAPVNGLRIVEADWRSLQRENRREWRSRRLGPGGLTWKRDNVRSAG